MKLEDIKVGMKVVPVRKSIYKSLEDSIRVKRMREIKQEFLYVIRVYGDGEISCNENIDNSGDLFLPSDLVPYVEKKTAKTVIITVEGKNVIASMGNKRGVAFCNPSNKFDLSIGADIALDRLFSLEKMLNSLKEEINND